MRFEWLEWLCQVGRRVVVVVAAALAWALSEKSSSESTRFGLGRTVVVYGCRWCQWWPLALVALVMFR